MKKLEWDTGDIFLNSLRDKVNEIVDLINVYNCTGGCGNWAPNKRDTVNKLTEDKCSCQPGLENLENSIHLGYCKFCGKLLPKDKGEKCEFCNGRGTRTAYPFAGEECPKCNGSGVKDVITDTDGVMKIVEASKPKSLDLIIRQVLLEDEFYVGSPLAISLKLSGIVRTHIKEIAEELKLNAIGSLSRTYNKGITDLVERI